MFDKLLLLSKGRMGFFGTANDASAYFRKFNRSNFAKYSNPSDQMLLLVNSDFSGNEEVLEILDDYDASSEKQDLIDSVESVEEKDYPLTLQKASFLQQFGIQTVRLFKYVTRSPSQVPSFIAGLVVVTFAFWYLISGYMTFQPLCIFNCVYRQKHPSQKRPFYTDISAPVKSAHFTQT